MEFDLKLEENKTCWLYKYNCPCRTGACHTLPDHGCPVYRWFKEVINYQERREMVCNEIQIKA